MNTIKFKQRLEPKLEIIDGVSSCSKVEPAKKSLIEKTKKKLSDNRINKNYEKLAPENKFDQIIKESVEGLKLCLDYNQIMKEEYLKHKSYSYPGILPTLELINAYNLYITMLGIIDYRIDELSQKNLQNMPITANKHEDLIMQQVLLSKRQELVNEIIKEIKPDQKTKQAIETYPTHSALSFLYEEATAESTLFIDTKITYFCTAYNNGYSMSPFDKYINFEYKFDKAKRELFCYSEKLNKKIEKVKTRKK